MRHLNIFIATGLLLVAMFLLARPAVAALPPADTTALGREMPLPDETGRGELPDFEYLRSFSPKVDDDSQSGGLKVPETLFQAFGYASQPDYGDHLLALEVKRHPEALENSWALVLYQPDPDGRTQRGPTLLRGYTVQLPPPLAYKPAFFRLDGPDTDPLIYTCRSQRPLSAKRLREYALNRGYWPKLVLGDTLESGGEWEYRLLTKGLAFLLIRVDSSADDATVASACVFASGSFEEDIGLPDLDRLTVLFGGNGQPDPAMLGPNAGVFWPDGMKAVRWGKTKWPPPIPTDPAVPPLVLPAAPVVVQRTPRSRPTLPAIPVSAPGM